MITMILLNIRVKKGFQEKKYFLANIQDLPSKITSSNSTSMIYLLYICVVYGVIMIFSITKKKKKNLVELLQNLLSNYKSPTMIMMFRRLFYYMKRKCFLVWDIFSFFVFFSICTQISTHYIYGIVLNYGQDQFYLFFMCKNMILRRHKRVLKKE